MDQDPVPSATLDQAERVYQMLVELAPLIDNVLPLMESPNVYPVVLRIKRCMGELNRKILPKRPRLSKSNALTSANNDDEEEEEEQETADQLFNDPVSGSQTATSAQDKGKGRQGDVQPDEGGQEQAETNVRHNPPTISPISSFITARRCQGDCKKLQQARQPNPQVAAVSHKHQISVAMGGRTQCDQTRIRWPHAYRGWVYTL
jgi:hypothetical protein